MFRTARAWGGGLYPHSRDPARRVGSALRARETLPFSGGFLRNGGQSPPYEGRFAARVARHPIRSFVHSDSDTRSVSTRPGRCAIFVSSPR